MFSNEWWGQHGTILTEEKKIKIIDEVKKLYGVKEELPAASHDDQIEFDNATQHLWVEAYRMFLIISYYNPYYKEVTEVQQFYENLIANGSATAITGTVPVSYTHLTLPTKA